MTDMNDVDYQKYLASPEWGRLREQVRKRSGNRCERCGARQRAVHHLTYERKGHERLEDLQAVCKECHEFLSGIIPEDPAEELSLNTLYGFLKIDKTNMRPNGRAGSHLWNPKPVAGPAKGGGETKHGDISYEDQKYQGGGDYRKFFFAKEQGISLAAEVMIAIQNRIDVIEMVDRPTNTVWVCRIEAASFARPYNEGFGNRIAIPIKYWSHFDADWVLLEAASDLGRVEPEAEAEEEEEENGYATVTRALFPPDVGEPEPEEEEAVDDDLI